MNTDIIRSAMKHFVRLVSVMLAINLGASLVLDEYLSAHAANALITWGAVTDSRVAGYRVYYKTDSVGEPYNGTGAVEGNSPVDALNKTSKLLTGLDASKTYHFVVTAYDAAGNESGYSNVVTIASFALPEVSIASPADGTNVGGTVSVTANATDSTGISKVDFYVNGVLQATQTTAPYVYSWNTSSLASGTYTLSAKAYNSAGGSGQSGNVSVNVVNDLSAPVVALTSPVNNATVSGIVSVACSATDNVGVSKVELYVNGAMLQAGNQAPYNFSWDTRAISSGAYALYAKAYDNSGNTAQSASVSVMVSNDTTEPVVTSFSMPATASSEAVAISAFTATDNVGVTGYLVTETAAVPAATAAWSGKPPTTFVFSSMGTKTAYAWARDAVGNVSGSMSATVVITPPDLTSPMVTVFTMPATSASQTVAVSSFTATDNVGVSGYMVTESSATPSASAAGWNTSVPASFTFSSEGTKTAYAWAKDAAGNVSAGMSATVTIASPDTSAPVVSAFSMPASSASQTVSVSGFAATDNVGVTGYMITESASTPLATSSGWGAAAPSSFTFSSEGTKTAFAWAKDAAGNISASRSATVVITLPDTTAPMVTAFSMPTASAVLAVPVTSFTATDNKGVTGYLISESPSAPAATAGGWTALSPVSFTFSGFGTKTAYAWVKDAGGNVAGGFSATVSITQPDTTAPVVTAFSMPLTASSLSVSITSFSASDNIGVTGYLVTESSTVPAANTTVWSSTKPTSFKFSTSGTRTAYAWVKDAAGNISASRTATVSISLKVRRK